MENREVINWLTRIRDRLMTTNSKQYEALTIAISSLEKQEQDRWIPVTERLPEETDEVLTTYINNGNRKKRYVETATYYPDGGDGTWSSPWDEYRAAGTVVEVLAWRPLPKPYKLEDEA